MSTTKDMAAALQDVRKMRRSLRLRKEQDPEVVASTLDTILKESIAVRAGAGGRLGKGAVNELRNIRRSMIAGQIDSGSRTSEFIGKYSMILDQISDTQKKTQDQVKKSGGDGPGVAGAISQNLPSADAITSALITANPLMGYSVKIAKDVFSAGKKRRKAAREIERQELENLNKEEKKLEEDQRQAPEGSEEQEMIGAKLDLIRDEIKQLVAIWTDGDSKLERITDSTSDNHESNNETNDKLERLVEETDETNRLQRESQSRSDLLERESQYENTSFGAGSIGSEGSDDKEKDMFDLADGMFAGFGGAIGGIFGTLATKMLAPFVGLVKFIKTGGSILGRLGRVSGLLAAAWSIYDFVDGFSDAGDILSKQESEVSITDRLRVGSASVISGLLTPVDWVLDFMGMGFMEDKDSFTAKIANSESELLQFMLSPASWILDYVRNFDMETAKENLISSASAAFDVFKDTFSNITDSIVTWMDETFDVSERIEKIKEMISEPIDKMMNIFENIRDGINKWFEDKADMIKESWLGKAVGNVFDFVSGERQREIEYPSNHPRGRNFDSNDTPTRPNITEPESITSTAVDSALSVANKLDESAGTSVGAGNVFAPNNSQSNVINNNISQGSSSSENEDRSYRRVLDSMTLNSL